MPPVGIRLIHQCGPEVESESPKEDSIFRVEVASLLEVGAILVNKRRIWQSAIDQLIRWRNLIKVVVFIFPKGCAAYWIGYQFSLNCVMCLLLALGKKDQVLL